MAAFAGGIAWMALTGCGVEEPGPWAATSVPPPPTAPPPSPPPPAPDYGPEGCGAYNFSCPTDPFLEVAPRGVVPIDAGITSRLRPLDECSYLQRITVSGAPGVTFPVWDTGVWDEGWAHGDEVWFVPDAPLQPEVAHTLRVEVDGFCWASSMCVWDCPSVREQSFILREPVGPHAWAGRAWTVRWDALDLRRPSGVGAFRTGVAGQGLRFRLHGSDPLGLARAEIATLPNGCGGPDVTVDLSGNPHVPVRADLPRVEGLELDGVFAPNGDLETLRVRALLPAEDHFGAPCGSIELAALGATCAPCSVSASGACLVVEGDASAVAAEDGACDP